MTAVTALHPLIQGWLLEGPLADHVPAYVERLRRGRYAANPASKRLNGVAPPQPPNPQQFPLHAQTDATAGRDKVREVVPVHASRQSNRPVERTK